MDPVVNSWRLNERHYGALQGLNKSEAATEMGEEQVKLWRRSFDVPPPALKLDDPRHPRYDPKYADFHLEDLPATECLKDTIERFMPYAQENIGPAIRSGKRLLVKFLLNDEKGRVFLTSMVSCLFARGVYTDEVLGNCLKSVGYGSLADNMGKISEDIQRLRWKLRVRSGYRPESVSIPKRFSEITTWKGQVDRQFMEALKAGYAQGILDLAGVTGGEE